MDTSFHNVSRTLCTSTMTLNYQTTQYIRLLASHWTPLYMHIMLELIEVNRFYYIVREKKGYFEVISYC